MVQDHLNQDQIAIVLRRAAELDVALGSVGGERGLDEAAVEEAAVEAGLSLPAVRRALAEYRAGLLDPASYAADVGPGPRRSPRRVLGSPILTVSRAVPGPADAVEQQLHRFLHEELFELRRDQGSRTTWIRRRGLEATARRAIDRAVSRRLVLKEVNHVDVSVIDHGEPWVVARLDIDVVSARHAQGTLAGSATAAGGSVAVTGTALAAAHPGFLVLASGGAGLVGLGFWGGNRLYWSRVHDIEFGVNGLLDRLERGAQSRLRGPR